VDHFGFAGDTNSSLYFSSAFLDLKAFWKYIERSMVKFS